MLMKPEKKSMAALIMGSNGPKKPMDDMQAANEQMTDKPEMDPGLLSAADEMMSALESKDVQGFAEALKSFLEMAEAPEASEPPQE